jgi:hypothetical protein
MLGGFYFLIAWQRKDEQRQKQRRSAGLHFAVR